MPNDQFSERERDYNDNLGELVGRYCTGIVEADSAAKDAHYKRILEMLTLPNAEFVADTSIIGVSEPLETRISVPVLAIAAANPIEISSAKLSLDMNVSASNADTVDSKISGSAEGEGKIGYGPFAVSVKVQASMATSKESKRTSDYRSTTHAEVEMVQGATPEGLALILDGLNHSTTTALEINKALVQAQVEGIAAAAVKAKDPALPNTGGGGTGGGGTGGGGTGGGGTPPG